MTIVVSILTVGIIVGLLVSIRFLRAEIGSLKATLAISKEVFIRNASVAATKESCMLSIVKLMLKLSEEAGKANRLLSNWRKGTINSHEVEQYLANLSTVQNECLEKSILLSKNMIQEVHGLVCKDEDCKAHQI